MCPYPTIYTRNYQSRLHRVRARATHTEGLASNLPASLGDLVPDSLPHLPRPVAQLSGESDDLGNDELGDGTRVGEGGVEDCDTGAGGSEEIDLVRSDTEASNNEELSEKVNSVKTTRPLFRER
jgi:hypothetical protein